MALICPTLSAQRSFTIAVWPDGAAEDNGIVAEEKIENGRQLNTKTAELFVYLPEKKVNTGVAVVICPGGGYARQAMEHEGSQFAEMLQKKGVAGIILKYRLPNGHHNIPLTDAQEAVRIVRANAEKWGIDPQRVGVSGFSAGGHLASTLGTHFDEASRPDFMLLFYPVVTMGQYTHKGSRDNLLGAEKNNKSLLWLYSNELQITPDTPPALFLLSDDDAAVPPANSVQMYLAMKELGIPASMHIFPGGGHGWGCRETFAYHNEWQELMWRWLFDMNFILKVHK
ncbi:MAG: alpha/beta hydrolase [Coprobacter sp.]|nr:alpha/beta hydrolase [Coprobacter sp.]